MNIFKLIAYFFFWPIFLSPVGWLLLLINYCMDGKLLD